MSAPALKVLPLPIRMMEETDGLRFAARICFRRWMRVAAPRELTGLGRLGSTMLMVDTVMAPVVAVVVYQLGLCNGTLESGFRKRFRKM